MATVINRFVDNFQPDFTYKGKKAMELAWTKSIKEQNNSHTWK